MEVQMCKHGNIHQWCDITGPCGAKSRERLWNDIKPKIDRINGIMKDCVMNMEAYNLDTEKIQEIKGLNVGKSIQMPYPKDMTVELLYEDTTGEMCKWLDFLLSYDLVPSYLGNNAYFRKK